MARTWQRSVVFIATAAAIYSLGHGLRTFTAVPRSTQPSALRRTVIWLSGDVDSSSQFPADSQLWRSYRGFNHADTLTVNIGEHNGMQSESKYQEMDKTGNKNKFRSPQRRTVRQTSWVSDSDRALGHTVNFKKCKKNRSEIRKHNQEFCEFCPIFSFTYANVVRSVYYFRQHFHLICMVVVFALPADVRLHDAQSSTW